VVYAHIAYARSKPSFFLTVGSPSQLGTLSKYPLTSYSVSAQLEFPCAAVYQKHIRKMNNKRDRKEAVAYAQNGLSPTSSTSIMLTGGMFSPGDYGKQHSTLLRQRRRNNGLNCSKMQLLVSSSKWVVVSSGIKLFLHFKTGNINPKNCWSSSIHLVAKEKPTAFGRKKFVYFNFIFCESMFFAVRLSPFLKWPTFPMRLWRRRGPTMHWRLFGSWTQLVGINWTGSSRLAVTASSTKCFMPPSFGQRIFA
jgi:hypothetical protein